ncbi:hypothetical protein H2200_000790 [Cladophialophora chaetospira]|uniref:Uncharacterized protein n=1 Tax=Cladophialophora chaetospira TaxID=386627 RepID=A0AA38XQ64_9EURO|nr:hypothetical protein H2200_000790 [Cladophialophora chaetospira]
MPSQGSIAGFLRPVAAPNASRKRKAQDLDPSDKENVDTRPKQRKSGNTAKRPSAKSDANKLYKETIKAIDTVTDKLDRQVKSIKHENRWSITTETYAAGIPKHLPAAKKLAELDLKLGFNLMMAMADASHCSDLDATLKMAGEGDSKPVFELLDEALLTLIDRRPSVLPVTTEATKLPEDADVGPFKTGRPNKQQWNQMYAQKLEHEKTRRAARRERRDVAEDWAAVALSDLEEERDYLKDYGVEGYFPSSIAKLQELKGINVEP